MTTYRPIAIDGLDIFYREAGSRDNPTILLLHGYPASSHMFRNLIPALADSFHLVAPDYPGFGYSSMPAVDEFDYTFDRLTEVMADFIDAIRSGGRRKGDRRLYPSLHDHSRCKGGHHASDWQEMISTRNDVDRK